METRADLGEDVPPASGSGEKQEGRQSDFCRAFLAPFASAGHLEWVKPLGPLRTKMHKLCPLCDRAGGSLDC